MFSLKPNWKFNLYVKFIKQYSHAYIHPCARQNLRTRKNIHTTPYTQKSEQANADIRNHRVIKTLNNRLFYRTEIVQSREIKTN